MKRKRTAGGPMKRCIFILGLCWQMLSGAPASAQEGADGPKGTVAAAIRKAGGRVDFDQKSKERPIVKIFIINNKIEDADLEQFKSLPKLRVLEIQQNKGITDKGLEHLRG